MMRSIGKARGGRRPWGRLLPALLWGMMHAANAQDVDFTVCAESEGVSVPGVSVLVWNGETDVPQASGVTGPDGCVAFRDVPTSVDEAVEVVDGLKVRLDGPNPADSYTRFVIEGRAKKAEVYDVLGRRVADVDLLGDRANVDLNLSSGVYFVRAYSDEGVAVGSFVKVGNSLTRVEFDKQEFTKANDVLSRMSVAKSSSGASLDFLVSSPNHLDIAEGRWVVDGDTLRFEVVEAPTARVKVYQAEDHYKQLSEGVIEVWTPDSTRIVTPDSAGVYTFRIPARLLTLGYRDDVHEVHSLQVLRASDHKGTHYGTVLGGMINESHVPLTAFIPDTVAVGNNPYVLFGPDGRPVANTVDADLFVMADTTWSDYAHYVGLENPIQLYVVSQTNRPIDRAYDPSFTRELPTSFQGFTYGREVLLGINFAEGVTSHTKNVFNHIFNSPCGPIMLFANTWHEVDYAFFSSLEGAVDSSNAPVYIVAQNIDAPGFNAKHDERPDGTWEYSVVITPAQGYVQQSPAHALSEFRQSILTQADVARAMLEKVVSGEAVIEDVVYKDACYTYNASQLTAVNQAVGNWPGIIFFTGGNYRGKYYPVAPDTPWANKNSFETPFLLKLLRGDPRVNSTGVVLFREGGSTAPDDLTRRYFESLQEERFYATQVNQ